MSSIKIAISLEQNLLEELDRMVQNKIFPNRSKAIQEAVAEKIFRTNRSRLAKECAKLDIKFEQSLAEEGMSTERLEKQMSWQYCKKSAISW
jgi:Arc/MetJ-type ribon-helix-helix transcriptional regulator